MDTKSGYPFWVIKNGLLPSYPVLDRDTRCDVLVIGGGITGALIADDLSRHGHAVVVVEKRDVGWGSTAASTALIQYEIDTSMTELAARYDEATAALAYRSCVEGVEELGELARGLGDAGYQKSRSVYLASRPAHAAMLETEQALRARHGVPSKLLTRAQVRERHGVSAHAALVTSCAAAIDPYRFTCRLFARAHRRGVAIYDRTVVKSLRASGRTVTARTESGFTIRAGHVVLAAGYEAQRWLRKRVARFRSTYACVSDPMPPAALAALRHTLFWETARPYHYVRTTTDHRVLVGGEDDRGDHPRLRDARVNVRARALERYVTKLLPELPYTSGYAWAGTFAETRDGLPYFGAHPQRGPRILFAMAYGGNGITYSVLGAEVLRAAIERTAHPLAELYSFDR